MTDYFDNHEERPVNVIKQCEFCETVLAFEQGGKTYVFTKHDDASCKLTMKTMIKIMREAMRSQAEVMARAVYDHGRQHVILKSRQRPLDEPPPRLVGGTETRAVDLMEWEDR